MNCRQCGKPAGLMSSVCADCAQADLTGRIKAREGVAAQKAARDARAAAVQLTTALTLAGHRITRSVDVVSAEYAVGLGILQGILVAFTEGFGGESETTKSVLTDARRAVFSRLRSAADAVGANAVIAVDLDYSEFSGGGKPLLFIVATGTAVVIEREPHPTAESGGAP